MNLYIGLKTETCLSKIKWKPNLTWLPIPELSVDNSTLIDVQIQ